MSFLETIREALFGPKKSRSQNSGDVLTRWERHYIESTQGRCPDCEKGDLCEGPSGGVSINMKCNYCSSKFSLVLSMGQLLFAERI